MEFQSSRRLFSKSNSTSRLFFNSPKPRQNSGISFPEQSYLHSIKFDNLHEENKKRTGFLISNIEKIKDKGFVKNLIIFQIK